MSLRTHLLDEKELLAGLLRKRLLLGAKASSESLRRWARKELNGYNSKDQPPHDRRLQWLALKADTMSGTKWTTNISCNVLRLPVKARDVLGEEFRLYQPVEELAQVATQKSTPSANRGLTYAQHLSNEQIGSFQEIVELRFTVSDSLFAGILGQIRTQLVDLIARLTVDMPLEGPPAGEAADAAVSTRIGPQYNTPIQHATGPTAIGSNPVGKAETFSVDDAIKLLDTIQSASRDVRREIAKSELLTCVQELWDEQRAAKLSTTEVVR